MKIFRAEKNREYKVRLFRPRPFIKNDWSNGMFFVHYHLPSHRNGILCEKQFGRECPVCDAANDIFNQAKLTITNAQPTLIRIAKSLCQRQRFIMPALVDDDPNPVIFHAGRSVMRQLADKEHFDCLYRGFDFTYVLKSAASGHFPYPEPTVKFANSRTPVPLSAEQIEDLTRNTPSFMQTKCYKTIPPDEQRQEVAAFIARKMKKSP